MPPVDIDRQDISHWIGPIEQNIVRDNSSPPARLATVTPIDEHRFPIAPIDNNWLLNDPQQGTRPFSWIPTTLKGATLKGEGHISIGYQSPKKNTRLNGAFLAHLEPALDKDYNVYDAILSAR
jgi:hypothetical protein